MDKKKFVKALKVFGKIITFAFLKTLADFTSDKDAQFQANQYINQYYAKSIASF